MTYPVDIWLRGTDHATTREITIGSEPAVWTEADVETVLKEMLRAVDREKNPKGDQRPVYLRGFSWIVNPFQDGGVVIAIELQAGAAVAGPFDVDRLELERMVARVMTQGQTRPGLQ
jgi:hypothetical protein